VATVVAMRFLREQRAAAAGETHVPVRT
jgi:hypothetical protein